jgi:hypothetical protein
MQNELDTPIVRALQVAESLRLAELHHSPAGVGYLLGYGT